MELPTCPLPPVRPEAPPPPSGPVLPTPRFEVGVAGAGPLSLDPSLFSRLRACIPGECELRPGGPRAHLHPAPSEEQVSRGLSLQPAPIPAPDTPVSWAYSSLAQPLLHTRGGFWGRQAGPRASRGLFSRDLVGLGYVETYTAANGSQVTERLPRQVWPPSDPPPRLAVAVRGARALAAEPSHPPPAGPLLLPGQRGGAPGLRCQPQHLCRPQVGAADQAGCVRTSGPSTVSLSSEVN